MTQPGFLHFASRVPRVPFVRLGGCQPCEPCEASRCRARCTGVSYKPQPGQKTPLTHAKPLQMAMAAMAQKMGNTIEIY